MLLAGANTWLAKAGVPAAAAHLGEVLAAAAAGLCLGSGERVAALIFLGLHGFFDYLDGALQRAGGRPAGDRPRAAMVHAAVDKAAEFFIFLGLGFGRLGPWWLVGAALATSLAATLAGIRLLRVKGIARERALFDRADRMFLLFVSLAANLVRAGLLAVLAMNCLLLGHRLMLKDS